MRILITGASGFMGSTLACRLLAEEHQLRALARDPAAALSAIETQLRGGRAREPAPDAARIEIVRGELLSGEGLASALSAIDVAYYLIHSMESSRDGAFPERERTAAQNFAHAASRAGVRRVVYLGGPVPEKHPLSRHLASRHEVEEILLDAVPDSVALRASIVIAARSPSFRFLVRLIERLPVLILPPWRSHLTQPIDVRDITEMLLAAASEPSVAGHVLDVDGPEVLSYEAMIKRIAELMLLGRPTVALGVSLTAFTARVAAAITADDPELILPLMESLQSDLLPSRKRGSEMLGVNLHSFDSAVEHALGEWESSEPLAAR